MAVHITFLRQPPAGAGAKVFQILKFAATQQISFYILKWPFNFSLRFWSRPLTNYRFTAIMSNKRGKSRVYHRSSRLPAQYHGFFAVIKTLSRYATEVGKSVMMATDQSKEIPAWGEVDKMPPRKAEDIGKTLYFRRAGFEEFDSIRAPIHLPLNTRLGFKPNHWRMFGAGAK